jgi:hypothetical protein
MDPQYYIVQRLSPNRVALFRFSLTDENRHATIFDRTAMIPAMLQEYLSHIANAGRPKRPFYVLSLDSNGLEWFPEADIQATFINAQYYFKLKSLGGSEALPKVSYCNSLISDIIEVFKCYLPVGWEGRERGGLSKSKEGQKSELLNLERTFACHKQAGLYSNESYYFDYESMVYPECWNSDDTVMMSQDRIRHQNQAGIFGHWVSDLRPKSGQLIKHDFNQLYTAVLQKVKEHLFSMAAMTYLGTENRRPSRHSKVALGYRSGPSSDEEAKGHEEPPYDFAPAAN